MGRGLKFKDFENIYGYLLFAAVAAIIIFLRKPETLLHAQLWAEDGHLWFAQAHNLGLFKSLLISDGGYFQTVSRLVASLGLLVPLNKIPLVLNAVELIIQLAPALLLLSPRFKKIFPSTLGRLVLAGLYLALPNTAEIDGHLTSCQWYLAVSAFLVLIASPAAQSKFWSIFDSILLILSGLTGPFAIFLTPLALGLWWQRKTNQSLVNFILISGAALIQAVSVFFLSHVDRVHILPQLTIRATFAIFSRQVVFGLLGGAKGYLWLLSHLSFALSLISLVSFIAIAIIIYALVKGPLELKLFLIFGLAIFLASLITPTKLSLQFDLLKVFSRSTDGIRYWFIPMLSFASALVWSLGADNKIIKWLAAALLCCSIFGLIMDFRHAPYPDENFNFYAREFSALPKGAHLIIPITPPGWDMELIKQD